MKVLLEIEELVPLIEAIAQENQLDRDAPLVNMGSKAVFKEVSLLVDCCFGLDNDPDVSESYYFHMEACGFSKESIRIKDAIDRLIRAMYPAGVLVSIEVLDKFGTVIIHFNPGTLQHARHHPQLRQYR